MMENLILVILFGAFGGALRGIVGIAKEVVTKKEFKIHWDWFFLSICIAAVVGMIAASFFGEDLRLALLAGYAGSDFIEGLIKMKLKDKFEGK